MNLKYIIKSILPYGFVKSFENKILKTKEFEKQFKFFQNFSESERFLCRSEDIWPCMNDATSSTGFDRHYVYHTAWAARIIKENNPDKHIDISSSLYFCSMLSAFIPVEFYDYRPANIVLENLKTAHADLLNLHFENNSVESLSCMHTVEHVGLGRYGDPLDYNGDLKAMAELVRILSVGGNLFFVVPIGGEPIIQFNAHRIYTKDQIITSFNRLGLSLKEFSLIPEDESDGGLVSDPDPVVLDKQKYACGCFWFKKEIVK